MYSQEGMLSDSHRIPTGKPQIPNCDQGTVAIISLVSSLALTSEILPPGKTPITPCSTQNTVSNVQGRGVSPSAHTFRWHLGQSHTPLGAVLRGGSRQLRW